jgi:uncharacterized protein YhdP
VSLPQSNWAQWLPAKLTRDWKLNELKAGGELWLTWASGTVQSAAARLNAPQVKVRLCPAQTREHPQPGPDGLPATQ